MTERAISRLITLVLGIAPVCALSEQLSYDYTLYGTPGLIEMPTAESAEDAELAFTLGHFAGGTRGTLSFQMTPRLSGSFRYARINDWVTETGENTYDRSFDLRYRLLDDGPWYPAIAVGLQDFIGTGIYSGEYVVATKQLNPRVAVTTGLGWGRYGSYDGFTNPLGAIDPALEDRPGYTGDPGGQLEAARWFRGDAALFGGVAWQVTDRLRLVAEYSSDAYVQETPPLRDLFTGDSPWNFGATYALNDQAALRAYYLYGSELGASMTSRLNPRRPLVDGGTGPRPTPVQPRNPADIANLDWTRQQGAPAILRDNMARLLAAEGLKLEGLVIGPTAAEVRISTSRYLATPEAVGRTARIMTRVMPASVAHFAIIPTSGGMPTATVRLDRDDIEALEFHPDQAPLSRARAQIGEPRQRPPGDLVDDPFPQFAWSLGPYASVSYFDPRNPAVLTVGAELAATLDMAPGLRASGVLRQRIADTSDDSPRVSDSVIRHVRTDAPIYDAEGDTAITRLTLDYQAYLGGSIYGRASVGYFERMYGGVSAELLWKPVSSRLALGAELNAVRQRDFDQLFGFQDYDTVTGHLSAYYDFATGVHAQLDLGRYLAGDLGATLTVERVFDNGWRIGAFATFTDVSFEDFGEGSFDKGLIFTVPLQHFTGSPSARTYGATLRPLQRDGGARLSVPDRLYGQLRDHQGTALDDRWGRFWR